MKERSKNMFLSVCIPVYNAEKYLEECIKSIIKQNFNDYEIIISNDGSQDASFSIMEKWSHLYPDIIKIETHNNQGSFATRRICLEMSSGEYVYFIDADDYLLNIDDFSSIYKAIKKYKCDLLFFDYYKENRGAIKYQFDDGSVFEGERKKEIYDLVMTTTMFNSLWTKVIKRTMLLNSGSFSEKQETLKVGEDLIQVLSVVNKANRISYLSKTIYFYRTNMISQVHSFNENTFMDSLPCIRIKKTYGKQWGYEKSFLEKNEYFDILGSAARAVYSLRYNHSYNVLQARNYIKGISETNIFKEAIKNCKHLRHNFGKKIIIVMMKVKLYFMLAVACKFLERLISRQKGN